MPIHSEWQRTPRAEAEQLLTKFNLENCAETAPGFYIENALSSYEQWLNNNTKFGEKERAKGTQTTTENPFYGIFPFNLSPTSPTNNGLGEANDGEQFSPISPTIENKGGLALSHTPTPYIGSMGEANSLKDINFLLDQSKQKS